MICCVVEYARAVVGEKEVEVLWVQTRMQSSVLLPLQALSMKKVMRQEQGRVRWLRRHTVDIAHPDSHSVHSCISCHFLALSRIFYDR